MPSIRHGTIVELKAIVTIKNQAEGLFPKATMIMAQAIKPAQTLDQKSIHPEASR